MGLDSKRDEVSGINQNFGPTFIILMSLFAGLSCSSENTPVSQRELEPLNLTEELRISADTPDALVGTFSGLAVDSSGNIYTTDTRLQKIHMLSPEGEYLDSLGREGRGPGEFTNIEPGIKIQSNTLYVMDRNQVRINLLNLGSLQSAGTVPIPSPSEQINGVRMGFAQEMLPLSNGNILISFENSYGHMTTPSPDEAESPLMTTVSILNRSGDFVNKSLLQFPTPYPSNQAIIYFPGNLLYVFRDLSFYSDTRMSLGPDDRWYLGKSDSLLIREYNLDSQLTNTLQAEYAPAPFTDAHMDSVSEDKPDYFTTAVNEVGLPEYWPAFQDFLIDDAGHCWVQLLDPGNPLQTWWVFNSEGQPQWEFTLPAEIKLHEIQNGKAYGILAPEGDLPQILRYGFEQ